ncbi:hypothetical protein EII22_00385 [Coriobacteriales bacterium OH1046]|nr:hypothetical protein EII22_00385 [Coriobacteriales bacterium OH1046]
MMEMTGGRLPVAQQTREYAHRRAGFRARKAVALGGIIAIVTLGMVGAFGMDTSGLCVSRAADPAAGESEEALQRQNPDPGEPLLLQEVVIHIDGAVACPGVYSLSGTAVRVCDAVEAAGGLTPDADTSPVNLAQPVGDGMKIHIPIAGEQAISSDAGGGGISATPVNLNSAGVQELMELPGVGEQTARAICASRDELGPFSSVDDLMRVSGIGEKKLDKIRPYVCI